MLKIDSKKFEITLARKCMNRSDLARKSNTSSSAIYEMLNRGCSPKRLGIICKALGVDQEEIIVTE